MRNVLAFAVVYLAFGQRAQAQEEGPSTGRHGVEVFDVRGDGAICRAVLSVENPTLEDLHVSVSETTERPVILANELETLVADDEKPHIIHTSG